VLLLSPECVAPLFATDPLLSFELVRSLLEDGLEELRVVDISGFEEATGLLLEPLGEAVGADELLGFSLFEFELSESGVDDGTLVEPGVDELVA